MSDTPPSTDGRQPPPTSAEIDAACDRFEAAWQAAREGAHR
jgi:hypothetical protein